MNIEYVLKKVHMENGGQNIIKFFVFIILFLLPISQFFPPTWWPYLDQPVSGEEQKQKVVIWTRPRHKKLATSLTTDIYPFKGATWIHTKGDLKGVQEIMHIKAYYGCQQKLPYWKFVLNHSIYDKIYTIGYYSGLHSSLRDKMLNKCWSFWTFVKRWRRMIIIHHACIKSIFKSWLTDDQYTRFVFQKQIYSTLLYSTLQIM